MTVEIYWLCIATTITIVNNFDDEDRMGYSKIVWNGEATNAHTVCGSFLAL